MTKNNVTYSDHYSCILTLKNLKKKIKKKVQSSKVIFNTRKEGGWERYRYLTTNNNKLSDPNLLKSEDPDHIMNNIHREIEKSKFKAFGKIKIKSNKKKGNKEVIEMMKKKENP